MVSVTKVEPMLGQRKDLPNEFRNYDIWMIKVSLRI